MAEHTHLDRLLAGLGERSGMGRLSVGEAGVVALAADDGLTLHIAPGATDDEILLYAGLPAGRPGEEAVLNRRLLEGNATLPAGAAFALHPEVGTPMLLWRLPLAGLDEPGLERAVEDFLALAEEARTELAATAAEAEPPARALADLPPFFGIRV